MSLRDCLLLARKQWIILIVAVLIGGVLGAVASRVYNPREETQAMLTASIMVPDSLASQWKPTDTNLLIDSTLALGLPDEVWESTAAAIIPELTGEELKEVSQVYRAGNGPAVRIVVTLPDAAAANNAANQLADYVKATLEQGAGTDLTVNRSVVETAAGAASLSATKLLALGLAVGLVVGIAIVLLRYLTRRTVLSEDSIGDITDLPVLEHINLRRKGADDGTRLSALALKLGATAPSEDPKAPVTLLAMSPTETARLEQDGGLANQLKEAASCDAAVADASTPDGLAAAKTGSVPVPVAFAHFTRTNDLRRVLRDLQQVGVTPAGIVLVTDH
ncbi:MAG: hypothetical protein LBR27_08320 [Bifidobacteriaceae bacterium]|jgi:capsular polysaccharide biosynthesis protein|nr:hypothetical protein [Bifidobacteriaceae bacterium]